MISHDNSTAKKVRPLLVKRGRTLLLVVLTRRESRSVTQGDPSLPEL